MTGQEGAAIAAARALFPEAALPEVVAALEQYGALPHEREVGRVRRAIVELSGGDMDRLRYFLQCAKIDYRDVLAWRQTGPLPAEEGERLQAAARDLIAKWGRR